MKFNVNDVVLCIHSSNIRIIKKCGRILYNCKDGCGSYYCVEFFEKMGGHKGRYGNGKKDSCWEFIYGDLENYCIKVPKIEII